jgi:hypothetical protein
MTACGGGKEVTPADALTASAKAVAGQNSAKVHIEANEAGEGTMKADGVTSWKPGKESADVTMAMAGDKDFAAMAGADGKSRLMFDDQFMYMELEGEMAAQFGGKKWLKMEDTGEEGAGDDLPRGPEAPIAALTIAKDLKKVGTEDVNGQQATHFSGTVTLEELSSSKEVLKAMSEDSRDVYVKELKDTGIKDKVSIDVWIGEGDLAVRTVQSGETDKGPAKETIEYSSYGTEVSFEAPPADETADLAEMFQNPEGVAGGGPES